jgi:hypothetical protein
MIMNIIALLIFASFLVLPLIGAYTAILELATSSKDKVGEQWEKENPSANILRGHGGRGY